MSVSGRWSRVTSINNVSAQGCGAAMSRRSALESEHEESRTHIPSLGASTAKGHSLRVQFRNVADTGRYLKDEAGSPRPVAVSIKN